MSWDSFGRIMEYAMVALVLVGLWAWQQRSRGKASAVSPIHAVVVHTGPGPVTAEEAQALEDELTAALKETDIGAVDGHILVGDGEAASFHLYGPDADKLFAATADIFRKHPITARGEAALQYGTVDDDRDVSERRVPVAGDS